MLFSISIHKPLWMHKRDEYITPTYPVTKSYFVFALTKKKNLFSCLRRTGKLFTSHFSPTEKLKPSLLYPWNQFFDMPIKTLDLFTSIFSLILRNWNLKIIENFLPPELWIALVSYWISRGIVMSVWQTKWENK